MIPPIQDRDPLKHDSPGAPPRLQHGVPVTESRRHPTSVDVITIAELPLFGEAQDRGTSVTSCSSTAGGTDSPQSPLPDKEGEVDIQPHRQKMLVQFPFQKRKAAGLRETPSKESTGRFGVSSDKEDDSVITVSDDGSDPNGASTSTGRTVPTSHRKRSREGGPSDAPPTKKPADGDETAPQQEQSPPAETTEAVLIATRNELYGKDYPPVQEVRARLLGLDPDVTLLMPRLTPHHGSLFARRRWRGMHQT